MPDEESFLELLDIYMTMVEKQDEIIQRLSRMLAKMSADLKQYKTVHGFLDLSEEEFREEEQGMGILTECLQHYEDAKSI